MTAGPVVSADVIREMFSVAMSDMYKSEVPQYRAMAELVADVNQAALNADSALKHELSKSGELEKLGVVRHGAIRVGTAKELSTIRRLFAVMGMAPVGYYDLSAAGIPVHSTAFRPTTDEALRRNPFRIFTSLLRLELIEDHEARREAAAILAQRDIFTPRCLKLLDTFETRGELEQAEAQEFVSEAVETFRWRNEATVSADAYRRLHSSHPLIADIVCFKGPHINHLALRSLDIDAVQDAMAARGMNPKAMVEGPPRRRCPILLRQTSFKAIEEPISFRAAGDAVVRGAHSARFGEIEQRGVALTSKGRALYDQLLTDTIAAAPTAGEGSNASAYAEELERRFKTFPDDYGALQAEGLAFFRYSPTVTGSSRSRLAPSARSIDALVRAGDVRIEPISYEDFLPVSAAGIFRSNLEGAGQSVVARENRGAFEAALGVAVIDGLALYAEAEARSRKSCLQALGLGPEAKRQGADC